MASSREARHDAQNALQSILTARLTFISRQQNDSHRSDPKIQRRSTYNGQDVIFNLLPGDR